MRLSARRPSVVAALLVLLAGPAAALSTAPPEPPSVEFGELYRDVELAEHLPGPEDIRGRHSREAARGNPRGL